MLDSMQYASRYRRILAAVGCCLMLAACDSRSNIEPVGVDGSNADTDADPVTQPVVTDTPQDPEQTDTDSQAPELQDPGQTDTDPQDPDPQDPDQTDTDPQDPNPQDPDQTDTDPATDPIDDPQTSGQPIVTATPILLGARAEIVFDLLEDSQLRGQFYTADSTSTETVTLLALPQHGRLTLEADESVFLYTADENYSGSDSFQYITFEGLVVTARLNIEPVNDAPRLSPEIARVAEQGQLFVIELDGTDGDGDALRYSATGLPVWLALDPVSGILSGTPTQLDIGFADDITLRVTDSTGLFDEVTGVRFEVIDVNDKPTLNLSQVPTELTARETVSVRVFPDDADGDAVTLAVEDNNFVTGSFEGSTITLTAADVNDVTEVNLVIMATDLQGGVSREVVTLTLLPLTESGKGKTISGRATGRGVHLVVLGDGYANDQQALFREHVDNVVLDMTADEGIAAHMGAFNIHMIDTISVDSGADDNEQTDSRDTAYDSTYNCREIERLICANTLAMFEAALVEYPSVDQIILLVNDLRYGGSGNSGGSVAITSAYYPEIALHEMGHSLADLADEYVDPEILESPGLVPVEEGRYANITTLTDSAEVPWRNWFDDETAIPTQDAEPGVGLFEGGLYRSTDVYRPTFDSRMRSFDAPFGPVNSERWILRLYTLTEGIQGFSPILETLSLAVGDSQEFLVSPLFGEDIQTVQWTFNGEEISPGPDTTSLILRPGSGTHELTMTVTDISGAIRQEPPHAGIFTWTWEIIVE